MTKRKDPTFLIWHILGVSPAAAEQIKQTVRETGGLDFVEQVQRSGGGAQEVLHHRLGDYFARIAMLSDSSEYPACMRLLFERLPSAGPYWKDLMVHLLSRVKGADGNVTINLAYQGNDYPLESELRPG